MGKVAIVLILFFVALASALEKPNVRGIHDYHRNIGIPLATELMKAEKAALQNEDGQRIVGGSVTLIQLVPYQVGIVLTVLLLFTSVCGGTLISDNTVLSAAHCFADSNLRPDTITLAFGSTFITSGGTRMNPQTVIIHPGFNPSFVANNIAVVRMSSIMFTLSISPIALPSGSELNLDYVGWTAVVSGYGITQDGGSIGLLHQVSTASTQIISNEECRRVYGDIVQDNMMCTSGAEGTGPCGGDFGGPLTVNSNGRRVLIGIVSFVAESSCIGNPAGYSRISEYLPWILSN